MTTRQALRDVSALEPLKDCVELRSGKTPARNRGDFWDGEFPWFSAKDLKSFRLKDSEEHITAAAVADGAPIAQVGELLILVRGMTLMKDVPIGVLEQKASFNQDLKAITPKAKIAGRYLGYMLAAAKPRLMAMVDQAGHGTGRLAVERMMSLPIWVPDTSTQEYIASRFQELDQLLEKQQHLLDVKRTFKRGLMQQLLTGQKRFPEFVQSKDRQAGQFGTVPKDWTVAHIGDIANEVGTRGAVDGSVVYSCTKHKGLVPSLEYFGKQVFSRNLDGYKRLQAGDFAYATNHIEEGSIGLLRHGQPPGLVSPMYTVFRPDDRVNPEFLFALLKTESYRRVFETRMSASVDRRGSLRWDEFSRIKIGLPSIDEQNRIASTLRLADQEIDQLAQLHELIEVQRRALLSKLLSGSLQVPV